MNADYINYNFEFSGYYRKFKFFMKLNLFLFSMFTIAFLFLVVPTVIGKFPITYIIVTITLLFISVIYCNFMQRLQLRKFILSMNMSVDSFNENINL